MQPASVYPGTPPPPGTATPPCPVCGTPMEPAYGAMYCRRCGTYRQPLLLQAPAAPAAGAPGLTLRPIFGPRSFLPNLVFLAGWALWFFWESEATAGFWTGAATALVIWGTYWSFHRPPPWVAVVRSLGLGLLLPAVMLYIASGDDWRLSLTGFFLLIAGFGLFRAPLGGRRT